MSKAAELAALIGSGQAQGDKNFIINGDMQCWQRTTAATAANNSYATVDRWAFGESTDGAYTSEQSTDTPTGTGFSIKAQVTTADTSMASSQYAYIYQEIEAQNLQPLQYGTSSAKTLTLSFWVKSNKTGTYSISVQKRDATVYYLPIEYTIDSANTWEKKTITISPTAGSTSFITASAGAIANDNGQGIQLGFGLAWGSQFNGGTNNTWSASTHYGTSNHVNWMDSTDNNFYLAQVQLEIGDVATAFEHEDFGTTLAKCQRYYEVIQVANYFVTGNSYATNAQNCAPMFYRTTKRAIPTVTYPTIGTSSGTIGVTGPTAGYVTQGSVLRTYATTEWFAIYNSTGDGYSGMTAGGVCQIYSYGYNDIKVESEL